MLPVKPATAQTTIHNNDQIMLEHISDYSGRCLFTLDIPNFTEIKLTEKLPSEHFLCLIAADFRSATDGEITILAKALLDYGASYFVCWGPGCERVKQLIDDLTLLVEPPVDDGSIILTTSHPTESLAEALLFFMTQAWPDPAYQQSTASLVAVSIEGEAIALEIHQSLSTPNNFVAKNIEWIE